MKRTKDAVAILKKRLENNPRLKALVEEERVNFQAALAIRDARKKMGLTQAKLAKEIGTTQSVIARLENADYRGHTLKMLEHIAEALGRRVEISFKPVSEHRSYAYAH
jgi:ribosome-binding protein aMBF1 (putative translation factor)